MENNTPEEQNVTHVDFHSKKRIDSLNYRYSSGAYPVLLEVYETLSPEIRRIYENVSSNLDEYATPNNILNTITITRFVSGMTESEIIRYLNAPENFEHYKATPIFVFAVVRVLNSICTLES